VAEVITTWRETVDQGQVNYETAWSDTHEFPRPNIRRFKPVKLLTHIMARVDTTNRLKQSKNPLLR
jgi:hypothetical protein